MARPEPSPAAGDGNSQQERDYPRWPTPLDATKRLVGAVVVLLNITLLFTPVPLSMGVNDEQTVLEKVVLAKVPKILKAAGAVWV